MNIEPYQRRTWIEIDLDAIKHNFEIIRFQVGLDKKICCVIKANAYGHGAVILAKLYEKIGADFFAVSNIEEALQLRRNNITLPILILGYTDPQCASLLAVNDIRQCVFSKEYGCDLSKNAVKQNVKVKIHIKLDTGMGRIGFCCKNFEQLAVGEIVATCGMPNLAHEGIFTHFASADEGENGENYTRQQFQCFEKTIELLKEKNIVFEIRHCANSAAIYEYPEMHLDMVRAGVILYGLQPSSEIRQSGDIRQALTLHSIVDHIKFIEKDECISYGRDYQASKQSRIATIPIGYADGLWRSNRKNGLSVCIEGKMAPIVGRICMDQCMVDVTNIDNVKVGSRVEVYGLAGANSIDSIAKQNHTINYEIICALGERVPRFYIENGLLTSVSDRILNNIG